jgi:broad specificity phosphatase PhoE
MVLINFVFLRHGQSCHNLIGHRIKSNHTRNRLLLENIDPPLSDTGLYNTLASREQLKNVLKQIQNGNQVKFDIIGSSPMIRAIETAYYTTNGKVFVFPFLRETAKDIKNNRKRLEYAFPMKSIDEQKKYFKSIGILSNIDFRFVENNEDRYEEGNIQKFLDWFAKSVRLPTGKHEFNVLIVLHSNVMDAMTHEIFDNNNGFVLQTRLDTQDQSLEYDKNDLKGIIINNKFNKLKCPVKRCSEYFLC